MNVPGAGWAVKCPCCFNPGVPACPEPGSPGHVSPAQRLAALRALMKEHGVDAYVVPSEDAHSSEYVSACDERRSYLSGFSGSAGTAVVTADAARLWTDGRYFLQAAKQLSEEWTLMKSYEPGVPTIEAWIRDALPAGSQVGMDPSTFPLARAEQWRKCWQGRGLELRPLGANLVDQIWPSRPAVPQNPLTVHPLWLAGEDVASKLARVRRAGAAAGGRDVTAPTFDVRVTKISYS